MILAPEGIEGHRVVDAFTRMAAGMNAQHERNTPLGTFAHGDGWGCSFLAEGRLRQHVSTLPCWEDPVIDSFRNRVIIALHARRATRGGTQSTANAHPFVGTALETVWHFMHNGTIMQFLPASTRAKGETDSEHYFLHLLDAINSEGLSKQVLERAVDEIVSYTSLNAFLYSGSRAYIVARSAKPSQYYTLYSTSIESGKIYSSEPLLEIDEDWVPLRDNSIVEVAW